MIDAQHRPLGVIALLFLPTEVIDSKFDMALRQTFGGDPGPHWKGGGGVKKKNWRRAADMTNERDWHEDEEAKRPREPDSCDPGGVSKGGKQPQGKQYGNPGGDPLAKKPGGDPSGSGPTMGKGKLLSDAKPAPDWSK